MVLTLYHFEKAPVTIYKVIKVSLDDNRQISVKIKDRSDIRTLNYSYQLDYQRLTVNVD